MITTLEPAEESVDGPLRGMPVAIKDNIDVQGVVTTNASTVGIPPPAERDATVVARLRAAGAELLCKTNLLEYAAGSVNPTYGMTFNPLDPSRTSGGSSSGSAALVAAGVCDFALGTDTGGSIRIPAAYCGIVGLKPTFGLVPVEGVFPLSPTCDHVGTLTRTVEQTATLLGVLAGQPVRLHSVDGLRIGVLRRQLEDPDVRPEVRARVEEAIERLAQAGFELADVDVPELDLADEALGAIILKEAYDVHRDLLAREGEGYGPGTRSLLEAGGKMDEATYARGLAAKERVAAGFARVFDEVDVLAGPTVSYPAPPEDPPVGTPEGDIEARFTGPYNLAGVPGRLASLRHSGRHLACGPSARGSCRRGRPAAFRGGCLRATDRMRIQDCNWMQLEEYLRADDRIVLPLGSVEQHAYLSLAVDQILAERVSVEAAEPLGVPVLPALPYGIAPYFAAYPGSPTLSAQTYGSVLRELIDALHGQGFRRFLLVNGHGGNEAGRPALDDWAAAHSEAQILWHNWWNAPRTWAAVQAVDPDASHASWLENFPWTRLAGVDPPGERKTMVDVSRVRETDPADVRELLGDGSFGGLYMRPDEDVLRIWQVGVEEVREMLATGWRDA